MNHDSRAALVFCYHLKKTAAESHRMLVEAYGEHALGKTQCFEWFKKFKSGDFDLTNAERGKSAKKFADNELQALLDEDDTQTQKELADQLNVTQKAVSNRLKAMGKIQKVEKWVPHELNERQQENGMFVCYLHQAEDNLRHAFTARPSGQAALAGSVLGRPKVWFVKYICLPAPPPLLLPGVLFSFDTCTF